MNCAIIHIIEVAQMTQAMTRQARRADRRSIRRKNLLLDQAKIDRARRIFRSDTDTDAIHRALDAAADLRAFGRALDRGFRTLAGRGGFVDRFDR
jgi:hypothetical protein